MEAGGPSTQGGLGGDGLPEEAVPVAVEKPLHPSHPETLLQHPHSASLLPGRSSASCISRVDPREREVGQKTPGPLAHRSQVQPALGRPEDEGFSLQPFLGSLPHPPEAFITYYFSTRVQIQ